MSERTPAEVFAPGEFVAEELKERGWHARISLKRRTNPWLRWMAW